MCRLLVKNLHLDKVSWLQKVSISSHYSSHTEPYRAIYSTSLGFPKWGADYKISLDDENAHSYWNKRRKQSNKWEKIRFVSFDLGELVRQTEAVCTTFKLLIYLIQAVWPNGGNKRAGAAQRRTELVAWPLQSARKSNNSKISDFQASNNFSIRHNF